MKFSKIFSFVLCSVLIFSIFVLNGSVSTLATSGNEFTYEQYLQGIEDGWIGEDVSFELLLEHLEEAKRFEEALENSEDFYEVDINTVLRAGDVLITNDTSKQGFSGHSAIALNSNAILHIRGFGHTPDVNTRARFINDYRNGWIRVFRPLNLGDGVAAANWADRTYAFSNVPYRLTNNLSTTHETYCSKLVWQAYFFGVGSFSVLDPRTNRMVFPYHLDFEIRNLSRMADIN